MKQLFRQDRGKWLPLQDYFQMLQTCRFWDLHGLMFRHSFSWDKRRCRQMQWGLGLRAQFGW